jgi:hypothetical protein
MTPSYLFEEIKVYTVSLLLAYKKIALFETSRDGSNIHGRDIRSELLISCHGGCLECCRYGIDHFAFLENGRKKFYRSASPIFWRYYVSLAGDITGDLFR